MVSTAKIFPLLPFQQIEAESLVIVINCIHLYFELQLFLEQEGVDMMYLSRTNEYGQSNSLKYPIDQVYDTENKTGLRVEAFKMLPADPWVDVNLGDRLDLGGACSQSCYNKNYQKKILEELLGHPKSTTQRVHKKHNWKTATIKAMGKGRKVNVELLPEIIFHWKKNNDQDAPMFALTRYVLLE